MASIAIIGSGFVGTAIGKTLAKQGHSVLFSDINEQKIASLIKEGYRAGKPEQLESEPIDVFFVTIQTPMREDGSVELHYLEEGVKTIARGALRHLHTYPIVVIKSTVPPGTVTKLLIPLMERHSGKHVGHDFGVAFEPEYLRERIALEDAESPRLIVIGSADSHAASVLEWLRLPFHRPIVHMRTEEAEMQKYVHNIWNATKISFFNEMRSVTEELDLDADKIFSLVSETAEASWNHRYGTRDFGPFDGSCLPKDTAGFLHWSKNTLSHPLPLLEATIAVNKMTEQKWRDKKRPLLATSNKAIISPDDPGTVPKKDIPKNHQNVQQALPLRMGKKVETTI